MENKYYTPSLEEFFVGFEYEYLTLKRDFKKRICDAVNIEEIEVAIKLSKDFTKECRVKYLDQEDIESLGFIDKENSNSYCRYFHSDNYCITLYDKNLEIHINKTGYKSLNVTRELFKGFIKNKSELIKLLNMLNIQ